MDQHTNLDEKTRRVRNLLSSYYGVDGAPSQGGSPRSEQSDTPSARSTSRLGGSRALAGLDSAAFDVERCISGLDGFMQLHLLPLRSSSCNCTF